MTPKKATAEVKEETEKASAEPTYEELLLKVTEMEQQLSEKNAEMDALKKKEEGFLVWTSNPAYNDKTIGLQFTDGMAFVPSDREFPMFKALPEMSSARRFCEYLKNDYGYSYEFYNKDQLDEMNKRMTARVMERKELEAKLGTQAEMLEKLIQAHQFKKE